MKKGIEYFPFDVDFFEDTKIRFLSARFGIKGEIFVIKLLCSIYRQGYYLEWDEDTGSLFSTVAGEGFTPGLANEILHELLKRDFFSEDLFKSFGILTSAGIQTRYLRACERRKCVEFVREYSLVDISKFKNLEMLSLRTQIEGQCIHDVDISSKNVYISDKNVDISEQSKVKYSKVNIYRYRGGIDNALTNSLHNDCHDDFKEKESKIDYERIIKEWNALGVTKIMKISLGSNRQRMLNARIREYGFETVLKAIRGIGESRFLLGGVTDFQITFDWFLKPNNFIKVLEGNYRDREMDKVSGGGFRDKSPEQKKNKFNAFEQRNFSTADSELDKKVNEERIKKILSGKQI